MIPHIDSISTLSSGRFLHLDLLDYTDSHGIKRQWEAVQRENGRAAVYILARMHPSDRILLIRQFRVPAMNFCIECPAGLMDPGESPEKTALRELTEETGYTGTIRAVFGPTCSSPGLTGEEITIVLMDVDEAAPENISPKQHLDAEEDIEVLPVPLKDLRTFLQHRQASGDKIDSRLATASLMLLF